MTPGGLFSLLLKGITTAITRRWIFTKNLLPITRLTYAATPSIAVAVGTSSLITTTTNGYDYTVAQPPVAATGRSINDVIYDGSRWIAVGATGLLMTSTDAVTWSVIDTTFNTLSFTGIAYNGTTYVICNSIGTTVTTTTDLTTFTSRAIAGGAAKRRIIYASGIGKFVAVGGVTATGQVSHSTDGISWTNVTVGTELLDIAYDGTTLVAITVAVATLSTSIYSSTDAASWTARSVSAATTAKVGITWGSGIGKFVVTTVDNVYTSPTGTTWTTVYTSGTSIAPGFVTDAGATVWAINNVTNPGKAAPSTTTNGTAWSTSYSSNAPASSFMYSYGSYYPAASYGAVSIPVSATFPTGGMLMMAGAHALVSTNGNTFVHGTGVPTSAANTYPNAIATPLCLVAGVSVATPSNNIQVSTDGGLSWTAKTTTLTTSSIIAGAGNSSISCVASSVGLITTSPTGATWTASTSGVTSIGAMVWDGTYFVAVGNGPTTRSTTGTGTWSTAGATTVTIVPRAAVWTGTAIIVVGNTGGIKRSTDHGATWANPTTVASGTNTLYSIAHDPVTNTTLIIGTLTDTVYRSTDHGVTWTAISIGVFTQSGINNVVWTGSKFIITCTYGKLLSSADGLTWDKGASAVFIPDQINKYATVTKLNGVWWAALTGLSQILTTTDLSLPWAASTTAAGYFAQNIIYANGKYVVGATNNLFAVVVLTSPTLTTLPTTSAGGNSLGAITFTSFTTGMYVSGLLYNGTNYVMSVSNNTTTEGWIFTSPDAITWTNRGTQLPTYFLADVNGILFAGRYGNISTSTDNGVTWNIRYTSAASVWTGGTVAYNGSIYVVVGTGKVVTTNDLTTWTPRTFTGSGSATSVIFDGEAFIVLCGNSSSAFSTDGINWTTFTWPLSNTVGYEIVYDGTDYVTVANGGAPLKLLRNQ
jgi:hypothetical protein